MKFPYGTSDFYKIATQGYYYADRTQYIRLMEEMGDYLLFLRPRRFGKSLWLNTLKNYYDVARKDDFEQLFGNLAISKNPTQTRNSYFILTFDFSCVEIERTPKEVRASLFEHINAVIEGFNKDYAAFLPEKAEISDNALRSFKNLLSVVRQTQHKLYLMIDEYDSFANAVLISYGRQNYENLVRADGLLRYVFREIKSATSGLGVDRVFATGVTPVVMSDVTSGANIFDNISLDRACSELCGLTESEVEKALKTIIKECGLADSFVKGALALMQTYYQGYYFHQRQVEKIFNPTLCLYFFKKFKRECEYPEEMLDANLAPDADNLRYIKGLPGGEKLLWELSQGKRITTTKLINKFGLKDMFNQKRMDLTFLTSFLWYSGIISIAGKNKKGSLIFDVPNLVIHGLFIDEAKDILLTDSLARNDALNASAKLYEDGEIEPVVKFVEQRIYPVFSNRDYIRADELSVKAIFLAILFEDRFFIMESERERRKGYPDLAMIVRPDCRQNGILDVIIEFKYISLSEMKITGEQIRKMTDHALCATDKVKEKLEQGKKQAVRYAQDLKNEIQFVSDDFAPAKWVVVSVGFERIVWKKV